MFNVLTKTIVADREREQTKRDQRAITELRESVEQSLGTTSDLHNRVLVLETEAKHLATKAWVLWILFTSVGIVVAIMVAIKTLL